MQITYAIYLPSKPTLPLATHHRRGLLRLTHDHLQAVQEDQAYRVRERFCAPMHQTKL
jgi:hypothetical protein